MSSQANAKISPLGGPTTASLVAKASAGDRDAFAALYNEHRPAVYLYLRRRGCTAETAEDLTQDTFVRALRRIGTFSEGIGGGFPAWLMTIARNLSIDNGRRSSTTREMPVGDFFELTPPSIESAEAEALRALASADAAAQISAALSTLTPHQRECLQLRYLEHLTYPEVASRMGRHPGAVKTLAFRALAGMRQSLVAQGVAA
ncbi:RNA polymerase sigma factor [Streptomyces sp. NPDC006458]|uniref:RNA polymerase sigma factor n=1 Tax=Streptomyces sp. NPDC006458 TaxID=3154302 RepID=UPI0033B8C055